MRALRLCGGPAAAMLRLGTSASSWSAACALSRRCVTDDATDALADLADDDGDTTNADDVLSTEAHEAEELAATTEQAAEPKRPLVTKLLPYLYSASTSTGSATPVDAIHLPVPQARRPLQRMQHLLKTTTREDVQAALSQVRLDTAEECVHYVNLVVAYIRHEGTLEHLETAASAKMRQRAEKTRTHEKGLYLTPEEQHMLLQKACLLVEQRRVPLVIASRLLRHRWPTTLRSNTGPKVHHYLADLVRNWTAEELQAQRLTARDARVVLLNCAIVFRSQMARARDAHSASKSRPPRTATEEQLAALIGSLATTAVSDTTATRDEAETIIAVMWAVHQSGCPAPMRFWEEMVRRVVQLNASLDAPLLEPTETTKLKPRRGGGGGGGAPAAAVTPVGHFFSGLTTRQLYRFLEVLKLVRWPGDVAVLHNLADQTLRNVAFELEAMPTQREKDGSQVTPADAPDAASSDAKTAPAVSLMKEEALHGAPEVNVALQAKRDVTRRIRLAADMSPREFFKLLSLAADLRVPFGVSAARVSEELLTPLVAYLPTRDLLTLMQIVRHTHSQSAHLLQCTMNRLIEMGPAIPYALTLSKTLIRTAASSPNLFAALQMDAFVDFFLDLCEAQVCLCRPTETASLAELLNILGRRYDESSAPGQRIRAVVNLLCTHMDRLLQLNVMATSLVEPLLETTVLLRMRPHADRYPSVQDLLQTRNTVVEKREARRAFMDERRERAFEAAALAKGSGGEGAGVVPGRLAPRWEDVPELQLPQLSKAAIAVYEEVAYMFERMVVVKAKLKSLDFTIFDKDMEKVGLFSLLHGVRLFQQGHLEAPVAYTTPSAKAVAAAIPHAFPRWMEKSISTTVLRKLQRSGVRAQSTDDEVLKLLGHVHCDAAKVDLVVAFIVESPLQMLKHQRPLWLYVSELARRFGSTETQEAVATYLSKSLF